MQAISLLVLIASIAIGFVKKINVGIVSLALGFVLTTATGMSVKVLVAGFPTKLFLTLLGTMYFFALLQDNKTLELLSQKIIGIFRTRPFLMPVVIYVVSYVMSAAGPGAISVQSVMVIFAVSLAEQMHANPVLLAVMAILGAVGGTASPIALTGIIVTDLTASLNVPGIATPVFYGVTAANLFIAIVFYFALGGYKIRMDASLEAQASTAFTKDQKVCLVGLLALVIMVVIFRMDVGFVSFFLAFVLMLLGAADKKRPVKLVPWNVLILICGISVLMSVIKKAGGIKLLADLLASMMTEGTAAGLIAATAGFMSWFSSANGVVFPTLIPTLPEIIAKVGGNVRLVDMLVGVVAAATVAGISPLSTGGSLIMATMAQAEDISAEESSKLFLKLFLLSFCAVVLVVVFALVGGTKLIVY
jgi:di/tricarboxylate transporter